MSLPDFLLTTIIQPYYFEMFYNISLSPRFYKYLIYNIEIIQKIQKEVGIESNLPEKCLNKIKKIIIEYLNKSNIVFSKIDGNTVMLVPENESIEKYIFYKNHDIVYNCQIGDEDLTNPYIFDDLIDYHYITYFSDEKDFKKYDELLSYNNSEIQIFTYNSNSNYEEKKEEKNNKNIIQLCLNRTDSILRGQKLENIAYNNIKKNFHDINFEEKQHIMFYLLNEEQITQIRFYHKLINNNKISLIINKAEELKKKYKDNSLIKDKLINFENKIKNNINKKDNSYKETKEEKKISKKYFKERSNYISKFKNLLYNTKSFLISHSTIMPDYLPEEVFEKIICFQILKEFILKYENCDKKKIKNIYIYINAFKMFNKINVDSYYKDKDGNLNPIEFFPCFHTLERIINKKLEIKEKYEKIKDSIFTIFADIKSIIYGENNTSPIQLINLIEKKRNILNEVEDIKIDYYEIIIKIYDIIIRNLPNIITTFKENIKETSNRDKNNILELYNDIDIDDKDKKGEDWNKFKSNVKKIINDKNNNNKYNHKFFDSISEMYKNKIKFAEELLENAKNEKSIMALKKELHPFNDCYIDKYNHLLNNNIFKKYIWDELLSFQIKYLMNIKYNRFCNFFGYNELDKVLYNKNGKYIATLKNLKLLFTFEIKKNNVNFILNSDNSIEIKKNSISFFEVKTNLNKENFFDDNDNLNAQYKKSIILTFIKNSFRFRSAFLEIKMLLGDENINLILIVNSKINEIPKYYIIMKKKIEYYVKNIKNDNVDFNIYLFHLDKDDESFNNINNNNSKEVGALFTYCMYINKLSVFILFILIIIFYCLFNYNISIK